MFVPPSGLYSGDRLSLLGVFDFFVGLSIWVCSRMCWLSVWESFLLVMEISKISFGQFFCHFTDCLGGFD